MKYNLGLVMNCTYISRESTVGSLDSLQLPPHLFVVPPAVHVESLPAYDIRNRSVLNCIFGFETCEIGYEITLVFCSAMAIISVTGF